MQLWCWMEVSELCLQVLCNIGSYWHQTHLHNLRSSVMLDGDLWTNCTTNFLPINLPQYWESRLFLPNSVIKPRKFVALDIWLSSGKKRSLSKRQCTRRGQMLFLFFEWFQNSRQYKQNLMSYIFQAESLSCLLVYCIDCLYSFLYLLVLFFLHLSGKGNYMP